MNINASANLEAINHLAAALDSIRQEAARLSLFGRALTPLEQQRLQLLNEIQQHLASFTARLSETAGDQFPPPPAPPPTVRLPRDGRYELGNDHFVVELRVDLTGMQVVSGDVFVRAGPAREPAFSFRSRPGVPAAESDNPLPVLGEDVEGLQSQGTLTVLDAGDSTATVRLSFDCALRSFGPAQPVLLTGRRAGDAVRQLGIELEFETNTVREPAWQLEGKTVTIESCFNEAGLNVFNVGQRNEIPSPPAGFWQDSQLHALMADFAQEPLGRHEWNLHLLMLSLHQEPRLLGVMFDAYNGDANRTPREGAAVFQTPIRQRPDWQRKLIQTTVHELGHALNLAHRFERAIGRADSISFMNYDWKYLGGNNESLFWQRFQFTFDDDELEFLRHGPRHHVVPGASEFHSIPYWRNTRGGYVPYLPEVPGNQLRLRLIPPDGGVLFQYGQPVFLTVELENVSGQALDLPDYLLDPKAGFLEIVVERTGGTAGPGNAAQARVFRPLVQRCYDVAATPRDIVPPGGKVSRNASISYGAGGFTFIEPGNYTVTAVLGLTPGNPPQYELVFRSEPIALRVAYPKTVEDERDALELFRPDIGYYLALGGSAALPKAAETLEAIRQRRQGATKEVSDPIVASIMRCQALHAARDYVRYGEGKFQLSKADPELANRWLESIRPLAKQVFDPLTAARLAIKKGKAK